MPKTTGLFRVVMIEPDELEDDIEVQLLNPDGSVCSSASFRFDEWEIERSVQLWIAEEVAEYMNVYGDGPGPHITT